MPPEKPEAWDVWAKHVLAELERLNDSCTQIPTIIAKMETLKEATACCEAKRQELQRAVQANKMELAMLKIKAGMWGAVAGILASAIPATVAVIMYFTKGGP